MAVAKNRILRACFFALGVLAVGLGVIGAFLPILPTTPFILLAAWCFLKSSNKAHDWIYRQPIFGRALRDWERNRSIARSTKLRALILIVFSVIFIWIKPDNLWIKLPVTIFLLCVSVFIFTRHEDNY